MAIGTADESGIQTARQVMTAPFKRRGETVVRQEGAAGIHESWVRPDGTIERNIKMDLVVAAAKKRLPLP